MEYLGIAGLWKKFEDFALSDPTSLATTLLIVAAIIIFVVYHLLKK
ncbi:MAG: hypothetical protein AB7P12_13960 [Alphaproteobacteria bacterium]